MPCRTKRSEPLCGHSNLPPRSLGSFWTHRWSDCRNCHSTPSGRRTYFPSNLEQYCTLHEQTQPPEIEGEGRGEPSWLRIPRRFWLKLSVNRQGLTRKATPMRCFNAVQAKARLLGETRAKKEPLSVWYCRMTSCYAPAQMARSNVLGSFLSRTFRLSSS